MHFTCHHLPRGRGGAQANVGEYRDVMGTLQVTSALVVGGIMMTRLLGKMWGNASGELREV